MIHVPTFKPLPEYLVHELIKKAQAGDVDARNRVATTYFPLVFQYARKDPPWSLEDMVQEGAMGLLKAIRRYDPSQGMAFGAYAGWWIRASLSHWRDSQKSQSFKSLDALVEEADLQVPDPGPLPEENCIQSQEKAAVRRAAGKAIESLRDATILQRRLFTRTPDTLFALGNRLGVSREWIRLREKALYKEIRRGVADELGEGP